MERSVKHLKLLIRHEISLWTHTFNAPVILVRLTESASDSLSFLLLAFAFFFPVKIQHNGSKNKGTLLEKRLLPCIVNQSWWVGIMVYELACSCAYLDQVLPTLVWRAQDSCY